MSAGTTGLPEQQAIPERSPIRFLVFGLVVMLLSSTLGMAGEPHYFSTWYAQPTSATTWASSSVMLDHSYPSSVSFAGPMYAGTPKYFQPGYGSVSPGWPYRSPLRYYNQHYSFGRLNYGSSIDSGVGPATMGGYGSSFAPMNMGQIGGLAPIDGSHRPWYFPGSPANDTEFQYNW